MRGILKGQAVSVPTLSPNGNISVLVNSSLTLTCTYTGLIPSGKVYIINWFRDALDATYGTVDNQCRKGQHLATSDYNVTCPDLNQQSITINRVDLTYHHTTWICECSVIGGLSTKSSDSATIFVNGQAVSVPTLSPNGNISVLVNSSLTLTCTYTGLIPSGKVYIISWFRDALYATYGTVDNQCRKSQHLATSDYNVTCPDLNQQSITINRVDLTYHHTTWICECSVIGGLSTKSSDSATIFVNVPVTSATVVEPVSNRINVIEGVPRRFMCKTSPCRPEATVNWYKQHNRAAEETITESVTSSYEITTDNLTITQSTLYYNASRNDMEYRILCKAVNTGSSIVTSAHQPQMSVFYAPDGLPTIQECSGRNYSLIENEFLTLTCVINGGNPRPTLTWTCFGGSTTYISSGIETKVRLMWKAERNKGGPCTCTSYHPILSTNIAVTINVDILYPPSTPIISINNVPRIGPIKVINDTDVPVICSSVSKPQPTYSWTYGTIKKHGNSVSLTVDEDGQVICTASNNMTTTDGGSVTGSSSADIRFHVLYGPSIPHIYCLSQNIQQNIDGQAVNVIDGDELTMLCSSNGNPQPTYTWNGYDGGNQTFRLYADLNYTCTARNVLHPNYGSRINMSTSRTALINQLYGPKTEPTLIYKYTSGQTGTLKTSVNVVENSSISITCDNSSSRPSPTYQWVGIISSPNGILNITTIKRSTNVDENGLSYYDYKCMVHNSMTNTCGDKRTHSETFNHTGRVNVLFPAYLNPVLDTGILEGHGFTLTATVGYPGSPRETYVWYYRETVSSTKTKISTTLTQYVTNISRTDRGFYTIEATNHMVPTGQTAFNASINETFYLDVFYKTSVSSFIIDVQQGNVTVNENSTVLFVCEVDSNPVSIVFLLSNTYNGESQITESILTANIEHTLPRATCYDTGLYRCIGKNEYTSIPVFRENWLFVKCTPRPRYDVDHNIIIYKGLGDSVTLNLTIIAYPEPSPDRFKWAKLNGQNTTDIISDSNIHIQTDGLETRLTITSIQRAEFGQYRLTIKYDNSTVPYLHYFYINPKDKPQKPTHFIHAQDHLTATTAVLGSTPRFDGGTDDSVASPAAAIGGAVGGVAALILLVVVVVVNLMRRKKRANYSDTNEYETPQSRTISSENDNENNTLRRVSQEHSDQNTYYNLDRNPYEDLKRESEDTHEYGTLNMSDDTEKHHKSFTDKTYENLRLSPMVNE